jgi:hypothetical protein
MRLSAPDDRPEHPGRRRWFVSLLALGIVLSIGAAIVSANASTKPAASPAPKTSASSMAGMAGMNHGVGPDEFGKTLGDIRGKGTTFTYSHGFFCDPKVSAQSATGCEVGAAATAKPPGAGRDIPTLFIAVPLGFSVPNLHCPDKLTCVDHPATVDMTRLADALAPIFKTSADKLLPTLKDFPTPGHDHFIVSREYNKPLFWSVQVIGVTNPTTFKIIQQVRNFALIQALLKAKNRYVIGPIPTNIFLFFAASS